MAASAAPADVFPALSAVEGLVHGFLLRTPGVDVKVDKQDALDRLEPSHAAARQAMGIGDLPLILGEQVHGAEVTTVTSENTESLAASLVPGADGFVTAAENVILGIHVADCAAVYLVDPVRKVIGLVHSGKKGTEFGIATAALKKMSAEFGTKPESVIVQVSPCIRPPAYEIDFTAQIRRDVAEAGVPSGQIHDDLTCTSRDLERYYSYRTEKGKTGRMLALMSWTAS